MTTATTMRIVGITDDGDCECCGRKDLKRRVVLEVGGRGTGQFVKFGTTCAAKAFRFASDGIHHARKATSGAIIANAEFADRMSKIGRETHIMMESK